MPPELAQYTPGLGARGGLVFGLMQAGKLIAAAEVDLIPQTGIDELIARDARTAESALYPNRMSPNAALSFLCGGLALLLAEGRGRRRLWLSQALTMVLLAVGGLAIIGYLYGTAFLYKPTPYIRISPYTACALLLVGLSLVARQAELGGFRLLTSQSAGGYAARRESPRSCTRGWPFSTCA